MNPWETPTACITNASHKLSRTFANYFAAKGYSLVLTGLDRKKLKSIAESIRWEYQVSVNIAILDLTNPTNVQSFIKHWINNSSVEIFINNTTALFDLQAINRHNPQQYYQVDLLRSNTEILTKAVVEEYAENDKGALITIASTPNHKSKVSLSENNQNFLTSLHRKIVPTIKNSNIQLQLLCPVVEENFIFSKDDELWEDKVLKESIKGLIQKTPIVKINNSSLISSLLSQILPSKGLKKLKRRKAPSL